MVETIAAKLDRIEPATCDICNTPMPRCEPGGAVKPHKVWRICPHCGHDICGPDAKFIRKCKGTA